MCDEHEVGYRENAKPKKIKNTNEPKWFWPFVAGFITCALPAVLLGLALSDHRVRDVQPPCHDIVHFKVDESKPFSCEDSRAKMESFRKDWSAGIFCQCQEK